MHEQHGKKLPRSRDQRPLRTTRPLLRQALQAAGMLGAALFAGSAGAVGLQGDGWTVDVGGIVNAYYTASSCSGDAVGGPALAGKALGWGRRPNASVMTSPLVPLPAPMPTWVNSGRSMFARWPGLFIKPS